MAGKGGKRVGAGRKSKAQEFGLDSLMDSTGPSEDVLKRLYSLAVGSEETTDPFNPDKIIKAVPPNTEAIKLWLGYKFGTPKQSMAIDHEVEVIVTHES